MRFLLFVLAFSCCAGFAFPQAASPGMSADKRKEFVAASALPGFSEKVLAYVATLKDTPAALAVLDDMIALPLSPRDTIALLREKAALLEILGSWKLAAEAWSLVQAGSPGTPADTDALLSAAVCLLNTGDVSATLALTASVDYSKLDRSKASQFMLVSAWAEYMRGNNLKASVLANSALASDNVFLRFQALLLMKNASTGSERTAFSNQLSELMKKQPELADAFAPYMLGSSAAFSLVAADPEPAKQEKQAEKPADPEDSSPPKFYQVGAFGKLENAKEMVERLKSAGISGILATKKNNSETLYIVYVDGAPDPSAIVLRLKDAGLEAWPLVSAP